MDKPVLFFSHSSKDKEYISFLRDRILEKTSNTVDVFQSSDGESIPFGNNWVHKIEENLKNAKVMFVFTSPESLNSNWIYFESGFAYSSSIKVIPIGIKGIDVGTLPPPLSLLQGFNINSEGGVNNIISIINKEFDCTYPESFSKDEYRDLSQYDELYSYNSLQLVDSIRFEFPEHLNDEIILHENPFKQFEGFLNDNKAFFCYSGDNTIHSYGMEFRSKNYCRKYDISGDFFLAVSPKKAIQCPEIFNNLPQKIYKYDKFTYWWFYICFAKGVKLEKTDYKLSELLYRQGINISKNKGNRYNFAGVDFYIETPDEYRYQGNTFNESLRVNYHLESFNPKIICDLIEKLINAKAITTRKKILQ